MVSWQMVYESNRVWYGHSWIDSRWEICRWCNHVWKKSTNQVPSVVTVISSGIVIPAFGVAKRRNRTIRWIYRCYCFYLLWLHLKLQPKMSSMDMPKPSAAQWLGNKIYQTYHRLQLQLMLSACSVVGEARLIILHQPQIANSSLYLPSCSFSRIEHHRRAWVSSEFEIWILFNYESRVKKQYECRENIFSWLYKTEFSWVLEEFADLILFSTGTDVSPAALGLFQLQ